MTVYATDLALAVTDLLHTLSSRRSLITYAVDASSFAGTPQDLANALQDSFADIWAPQLDSTVTIGPTAITLGNGDDTPFLATSNIALTTATRVGNAAPPNNNMLMKKLTGLGGRTNRGRMYLPWSFDEIGVSEVGIFTPGEVSGAQTRATAYIARLFADGTPMCIANRVYDLPWTNPTRQLVSINMGPPVAQLLVDPLVASQRRRIGR